jgi:D-serine deaminase-like pyridoxal phosphate-dependent protein
LRCPEARLSADFDWELGINELQAGTYVFMDVNYRDVVLRSDDAHPFRPALSVRTTVISASQPGFVVTDAGVKEFEAIGDLRPAIVRGAPRDAEYSLVGDDMGRIEFAHRGDRLAVGDIVEVMPPHCYQAVCMYLHYHVVRGDELVDIWPVDAHASW